MLLNLFGKHGPNWSLIGKSIPDRLAKSCWSRWLSLQRTFTPEEDEMLQNLVQKHANRSLIVKSIPGKLAEARELRWQTNWSPFQSYIDNSTLKWKSSSLTNEDLIVSLMKIYTYYDVLYTSRLFFFFFSFQIVMFISKNSSFSRQALALFEFYSSRAQARMISLFSSSLPNNFRAELKLGLTRLHPFTSTSAELCVFMSTYMFLTSI